MTTHYAYRKLILALALVILVSASVVIAAAPAREDVNKNDPLTNPVTLTETPDDPNASDEREKVKASDNVMKGQELRNRIEEKAQELDDEVAQLPPEKQEQARKENAVRVAVHALLELENRTGGIGQQVREVARDFNNAQEVTKTAEEKIAQRGWFTRLFAGGDDTAARDIINQSTQTVAKLEELRTALKNCVDCTDDERTILEEQITTLETEQTRLKELATVEMGKKGLFGWLWK